MKFLIKPFALLIALSTTFLAIAEEKSEKKSTKKKGYEQFIAEGVNTDEGLFTVYTLDDNTYFEIPDALHGREMLLGSRVIELSNDSKVMAGEMRKGPVMIEFSRDDKNVYMHQNVSNMIVDENAAIKKSVDKHSVKPILATFKIEALNSDSTAAVIDVTKFFSEEIKVVSPFNSKFKAGSIQKESTFIQESLSFPENIEIRTQMNYKQSNGTPFLIRMNRSILLLPEEPMQPRYEDPRVGYFAMSRHRYAEDVIGVESLKYISRFEMKARPEDVEKHKRGELVEPENPIVYYIDDAFPADYITYVKMGVENWQKAFEAIGFKNAITAQVYPQNDPEFHPEDIRYSCIRYISQAKANAMGPHWSDPRSGETIGGEVFWWHNVTVRLRNWMFIQCAPNEPLARLENTDIELLGPMIRYVVAHEVGHNLGLKHNMGASYAYPVDSLRSSTFTQKYGTTPSIMDYARFNYVAQPGDENVRLLPPNLGIYDYFAIKWGYAPIYDAENADDELATLNSWILEHKDDPNYYYGDQQMGAPCQDPASQSEAVGDDAVKASIYGVKNLAYIMDHLVDWTVEENGDYDFMREIYSEALKQHKRYIGHVISYIGGVSIYKSVGGETRPFYTPETEAKQVEAINWVMDEMFNLPNWALPAGYELRVGPQRYDMYKLQASILDLSMSPVLYQRLQMYHEDYTVAEYLEDISDNIWSHTIGKDDLTDFDKHLQATFIHNLIGESGSTASSSKKNAFLEEDEHLCNHDGCSHEDHLTGAKGSKILYTDNGVKPVLMMQIDRAQDVLKKQLKHKDPLTRAHYEYLYSLIKDI